MRLRILDEADTRNMKENSTYITDLYGTDIQDEVRNLIAGEGSLYLWDTALGLDKWTHSQKAMVLSLAILRCSPVYYRCNGNKATI